MIKLSIRPLLILALLLANFQALAQSEIYLFRHAEKQSDGTRNPPLTKQGEQRAKWLAHWLKDKKVTAIYSSDYKRTRQTVKPIAKQTGLTIEIYDPSKLEAFAKILKPQTGVFVVVGHSNTLPDTVRLLGGDAGTAIDHEEYDRLYQLSVLGDKVTTKRHNSKHQP